MAQKAPRHQRDVAVLGDFVAAGTMAIFAGIN
jgi:hypothetical protein